VRGVKSLSALGVLAFLFTGVGSDEASAATGDGTSGASSPVDAWASDDDEAMTVGGGGRGSGEAAEPTTKPVDDRHETPPPPPPEDVVYEPSWGTHPETAEPCIQLTRVVRPGVANTGLATDYEHRALTMLGDERLRDVEYLFCRDVADEEGPGPAVVAQAFVRSIGIPSPEPQIDPGWAMTGMPAYLVINGQEAFTHQEAIPGFGELSVAFEATTFEVDWGDGTTTFVDDGRTGVPYDGPESEQISHTYADVASGNVVRVDARWHASWELAGFSGIVGGLQTSEEYPLEVREMQTVRTSGR
jgi:hypothetical protein